jgi:hypothetical protein
MEQQERIFYSVCEYIYPCDVTQNASVWVDEYGPEKAAKIWRQNVRSNIGGYYWQVIKDKLRDIFELGSKFIGLGGS